MADYQYIVDSSDPVPKLRRAMQRGDSTYLLGYPRSVLMSIHVLMALNLSQPFISNKPCFFS